MGALRIEEPADLPVARTLVRLLKAAARLNEEKGTQPKSKATKKKASRKEASGKSLAVPEDLSAELNKAKRQETRAKRLATALEYMNQGKPRNWKYMKEWR